MPLDQNDNYRSQKLPQKLFDFLYGSKNSFRGDALSNHLQGLTLMVHIAPIAWRHRRLFFGKSEPHQSTSNYPEHLANSSCSESPAK